MIQVSDSQRSVEAFLRAQSHFTHTLESELWAQADGFVQLRITLDAGQVAAATVKSERHLHKRTPLNTVSASQIRRQVLACMLVVRKHSVPWSERLAQAARLRESGDFRLVVRLAAGRVAAVEPH